MIQSITRRKTIQVPVGKLVIGSEHPVRVQSMTNTNSQDVEATITQIRSLQEAGCELIRATIPDAQSAANIPAFMRAMDVPFIADIHFNHKMALAAIEAEARERGLAELKLETGGTDPFADTWAVYERCGFVRGTVFADYPDTQYNVFYEKKLTA